MLLKIQHHFKGKNDPKEQKTYLMRKINARNVSKKAKSFTMDEKNILCYCTT